MDQLVEKIKNTHITNVKELYDIINDSDIRDFTFDKCFGDNYTRKIIYRDTNKEIIMIQWNKNARTGVHDHPENGCIIKLLCGRLKEYIYDYDRTLIESKIIKQNDISYIDSDIGQHKIVALEDSCSLHVYSPPGYYD